MKRDGKCELQPSQIKRVEFKHIPDPITEHPPNRAGGSDSQQVIEDQGFSCLRQALHR